MLFAFQDWWKHHSRRCIYLQRRIMVWGLVVKRRRTKDISSQLIKEKWGNEERMEMFHLEESTWLAINHANGFDPIQRMVFMPPILYSVVLLWLGSITSFSSYTEFSVTFVIHRFIHRGITEIWNTSGIGTEENGDLRSIPDPRNYFTEPVPSPYWNRTKALHAGKHSSKAWEDHQKDYRLYSITIYILPACQWDRQKQS